MFMQRSCPLVQDRRFAPCRAWSALPRGRSCEASNKSIDARVLNRSSNLVSSRMLDYGQKAFHRLTVVCGIWD